MFRLSGLWQTAWLQVSLKNNLFLIDAILILTGSISLLTYVSLSIFTLLRHKKATKRENTSPKYAFSINSPNEVTSETTPAASSEWMFLYLTDAINLVAVIAGISLFWLVASGLLQFRNYQDIPLSLSSIQLFVIFYFVYFNEAIFYPPKAEKINDLNRILANRILMIMQESKPFLNPDLTLAGFAESIDNKPHTISKTINECFNKNFRDFINEYRVNEFIKKMDSEDAKNMTFLYLAYEAGFNSKSTFNLAFKKVTGLSPREYFSAGK
jgi:AraC-like DNA-binding protein